MGISFVVLLGALSGLASVQSLPAAPMATRSVTVVAPERDAELRHVLQKPSNDRTYDDILPVKNWLRATPWGKAMLESVMGLETFRIDEASSPLPRARHARRGA